MKLLIDRDLACIAPILHSYGYAAEVCSSEKFAREAPGADKSARLLIAAADKFGILTKKMGGECGLLFLEDPVACPRNIKRIVIPLLASSRFEVCERITLVSASAQRRITRYEYKDGLQVSRTVIPQGSSETLLGHGGGSKSPLLTVGIQKAGICDFRAPYEATWKGLDLHILGVLVSGEATLGFNGEAQSLRAGETFFAAAGAECRCRMTKDGMFCWFYLLPEFCPPLSADAEVYAGLSPSPEAFLTYLLRYIEESSSPFADSQSVMSSLTGIIRQMMRRHLLALGLSAEENGSRRRNIQKAIQTLHSNGSKAWSVEDLAREAGCSVAQFHRLTQKILCKTPGQMIRETHMQQAGELLARTDYKLERIASLVGYSDAFSFARAFKKYIGESPGRYRERYRNPSAFPKSLAS
ncbi:MAG: hypothetical protein BGO12_05040 [Verrucomicrobia bacterium 61-8]|nr:helix-turn-helix transcriptional regulator [Verrucomicrobiota bacterium]OJV19406.1 MAG: hypothetical protein BGO12_05040 [Verrucomicrobia bacterium 61-8]